MGDELYQQCSGVRCQVSAVPLAKKAAGLIEKETLAMQFHMSGAAGQKNGQSNRERN